MISAGSLLEQVISEVISFPVGRVEYLYLHPLKFLEFLKAKGQYQAVKALTTIPIASYAHDALLQFFHEYAIVGGMPEVVNLYVKNNNVTEIIHLYEGLWTSYKDDVKKYASNTTDTRVINHVISTAHLYLDQRIKFEKIGQSNYRSREVGEAIRNLNDVQIIQLIYPTTDTTSPLKPNLHKSPRLQFLDTGLVNYMLQIHPQLLAMDDLSNAYKGALIPLLIYQELISLNSKISRKPHFWVRDKTQSTAEVDIVLPYQDKIIPIDIKSGKTGMLKSLHQFIEQSDHPYAVRIYGGPFSIEQHYTPRKRKDYLLMNLPYYLGTKLHDYLAYFVDNHCLSDHVD